MRSALLHARCKARAEAYPLLQLRQFQIIFSRTRRRSPESNLYALYAFVCIKLSSLFHLLPLPSSPFLQSKRSLNLVEIEAHVIVLLSIVHGHVDRSLVDTGSGRQLPEGLQSSRFICSKLVHHISSIFLKLTQTNQNDVTLVKCEVEMRKSFVEYLRSE